MPMYTVSTRKPLAASLREKIALSITDAHCDVTGAPRLFVNVIFSSGVPLRKNKALNILANIRAGRSIEEKLELHAQLVSKIIYLMKISEQQTEIDIIDVPAKWVMEGGEIFPEPGDEDSCEWLKKMEASNAE